LKQLDSLAFQRSSLQYEDRAFSVVNDTYVTATEGTGIVHQAPAFGEDDHRIAIASGILQPDDQPPCPIDDSGRFTAEVLDFEGQYVKVSDVLYIPTSERRSSKPDLITGRRQGDSKTAQAKRPVDC
jgi:isoleucyl-tRNA synthetase